MAEIDLENRDPNNINDHLKVQFEDVLAEPCCWKCTNKCFNCAFKCCYMLMTLCGPLYGLYYGWSYAMLACDHEGAHSIDVWRYTPQIRACEINCTMMRKVYTICLNCCLTPFCESCGAFFSRIQVKQ
uniref:Caveolin n=1 Tax=Haliotis discus discus TaxID=91233 RepID=A0A1X9I4F0_HALDI|nr:caveolin-1 [Haliotis discus discus]